MKRGENIRKDLENPDLTDIAKREMIVVVVVVGVKEGKTMVVRGEEIWVVEAAVAGGAEGDVVGGAEK